MANGKLDANDMVLKDIFCKKSFDKTTTIIDIKSTDDKNFYYTSDYLEPGSIMLFNTTINYTSEYDNKPGSFKKPVLLLRLPTSKYLSKKSLGEYTSDEIKHNYKTTDELIKNIQDVTKELIERLSLIMKVKQYTERSAIKLNIEQINSKSNAGRIKNIIELNGKTYSIGVNNLLNVLDSCQCKIVIHISCIYSTENGNVLDIRLMKIIPKNLDKMSFFNKKMLFDEFNENTNNSFAQLKHFESFDISNKVTISKKSINNKLKKILEL
jgi:hypothetical protein